MNRNNLNTSEVLNESREVLFGDMDTLPTQNDIRHFMARINERLTAIETNIEPVAQINKTLITLVENFNELKLKVFKIENTTMELNKRCDNVNQDVQNLRKQNEVLNTDQRLVIL